MKTYRFALVLALTSMIVTMVATPTQAALATVASSSISIPISGKVTTATDTITLSGSLAVKGRRILDIDFNTAAHEFIRVDFSGVSAVGQKKVSYVVAPATVTVWRYFKATDTIAPTIVLYTSGTSLSTAAAIATPVRVSITLNYDMNTGMISSGTSATGAVQ